MTGPSGGSGAEAGQVDRGRLHVLDLLRFGVAMMVVGFHFLVEADGTWGARTDQLFTHPVQYASRYGWMGVEFFFVISGFVICMSSWGRTVSDFFISRVTRLMPAYVVAVLLSSAVLTLGYKPGAPWHVHTLVNLTLLQSFVGIPDVDVVYWTLLVELKFYLIFAIVVWRGLTYRRVVAFCIFWLTAALIANQNGSKLLVGVVNPQWAPYFVIGIALYLIHRFGPNLLLWGMLGTSTILMVAFLRGRITGYQARGNHISSRVTLALMFLFLLVMLGTALGWFSWLKWRGLTVVGALTYPLYLLHYDIGRTVAIPQLRHALPAWSPWLVLGCVVAGELLLAYLVHRLVERPVSRTLRARLKSSFAQIRAASAAP